MLAAFDTYISINTIQKTIIILMLSLTMEEEEEEEEECEG